MELSKLVFPPVFPHSVLCYKTHFPEHSKALGRGHSGRAGTVFLVTQARTGLKCPSSPSLVIALTMKVMMERRTLHSPLQRD